MAFAWEAEVHSGKRVAVMTHKQTLEAIRLSLLLGETTADRHGVYPRRKPTAPDKPTLPIYLMNDPTGFAPDCVVDWVPPND